MAAHYLVQRYFPALRIGSTALAVRGRREIAVHCRQSDLDSACGIHCAVMALVLLGRISNTFLLAERRTGVAARLWQRAREAYFQGMNSAELNDMLDDIDVLLHVDSVAGSHRRCLDFILQQCRTGRLAIASWKSRSDHHWVLVVGIEGMQCGHRFTPHALLCIDPGVVPQPLMSGCNARLDFTRTFSKSMPMQYLSADGLNTCVRLTGAVALGDKQ